MSRGDREARVLLAILRGDWREAFDVAGAGLDPGAFVTLCRDADVAPWVHARLAEAGRFDVVGPEAERDLEALRRKCRHDNLLLAAVLEEALDRLLEAGVVPIALKGIDFVHRFGIGLDERTLDDVDLLVPADRAARAVEALERGGWAAPPEPERTHWLRSSFELPLTSPGPVPVLFEVHWSLGQHGRYAVDSAGLVARARPLDVAGRAVLRLDDHDVVAHLLVHHLQHYFDRRLKWALDVARIVRDPGFSWPTVVERLGAWGGETAAAFALLHLAKTLPASSPSQARDALPVPWWRRLVTLPLRSSHPLDLFRGVDRRWVQLWLAAAMIERPASLPAYVVRRMIRDRAPGASPLERDPRSRR